MTLERRVVKLESRMPGSFALFASDGCSVAQRSKENEIRLQALTQRVEQLEKTREWKKEYRLGNP